MPVYIITDKAQLNHTFVTEIVKLHREDCQCHYAKDVEKVPYNDGTVAKLIDNAVRNLLQRVGVQGWEPVDALDADSLWAKGRVQYEDVSGFWARAVHYREVEPTTVSIFCRRCVK